MSQIALRIFCCSYTNGLYCYPNVIIVTLMELIVTLKNLNTICRVGIQLVSKKFLLPLNNVEFLIPYIN